MDSRLHTGRRPRAAKIHALTHQQQGFTHSRLHSGLLPPATRIHTLTPSRRPQQRFTDSRFHTRYPGPPDSRIHTGPPPRPPTFTFTLPCRHVGPPKPIKVKALQTPSPLRSSTLNPRPAGAREDSRKQTGAENLNAREGPGVPGNGEGPRPSRTTGKGSAGHS